MPQDIPNTENFSGGVYQVPIDKDTGNAVFSTLEDFMNRMAVHGHTGQDSKEITLNFTKEVQLLNVGAGLTWGSIGEGSYTATIVLPLVTTIDNLRRFYWNDSGFWVEFFPDQEFLSGTEYTITSNDNTIDIKIVYF